MNQIKIGKSKFVTINYDIKLMSGLTGHAIHCSFEIDGYQGQFGYHEFYEDKLKNGLTKEHEEIIKNIFIGSFPQLYFEYVSWS